MKPPILSTNNKVQIPAQILTLDQTEKFIEELNKLIKPLQIKEAEKKVLNELAKDPLYAYAYGFGHTNNNNGWMEKNNLHKTYEQKNRLAHFGFRTDTLQIAFTLKMYREDTNFDQIIDRINFLLPLMKWSDGLKYFSIFDHELSERDSRSLVFTEDGKWKIIGYYKEYYNAGESLEEALQYIHTNFWYQ